MAYYLIKSLTNTLSKRDINKDKTLSISYNIGFKKKFYQLPTGGEMIISCTNLPINIQKLRMKNLVIVQEISENEFLKNQRPNAAKKKSVPITKKEEPKKVEIESSKTKTGRKKNTESTTTTDTSDSEE